MLYTPPTSQDLLETAIILNPWTLFASAELPDVLLPILLIVLLPLHDILITYQFAQHFFVVVVVFCKAKIKCSFALLLFELHYYLLSY